MTGTRRYFLVVHLTKAPESKEQIVQEMDRYPGDCEMGPPFFASEEEAWDFAREDFTEMKSIAEEDLQMLRNAPYVSPQGTEYHVDPTLLAEWIKEREDSLEIYTKALELCPPKSGR